MTTPQLIHFCRELIAEWRGYDGSHGGDFCAAADELEQLLMEYEEAEAGEGR